MATKSKYGLFFGGFGVIVGILVGLSTLGFAMPWNAITKAEAAQTYETKSEANLMYKQFQIKHDALMVDILEELRKLNNGGSTK